MTGRADFCANDPVLIPARARHSSLPEGLLGLPRAEAVFPFLYKDSVGRGTSSLGLQIGVVRSAGRRRGICILASLKGLFSFPSSSSPVSLGFADVDFRRATHGRHGP